MIKYGAGWEAGLNPANNASRERGDEYDHGEMETKVGPKPVEAFERV